MAVIDLQRRQTEVGRIRLGQKIQTKSGKTVPARLETFRFTSPSKQLIEAIAKLYGGEVQPWQPPAGASEWEVITDTSSVPVVVPPQDIESSQFYELWSKGGVKRRCTGARELISDSPCLCDPDNRECKLHTRVNLMLRDVPGIGVWRLDTGGYYAAVELPGMVELLSRANGLVEALLELRQRTVVRDGETKHFVVPVLHVDFTPGQLISGAVAALGGAGRPAVEASQRQAIGSRPAQPAEDRLALGAAPAEPQPVARPSRQWHAEIKAATTIEDVRRLWREAVASGEMDDVLRSWLEQRAAQLDAEQAPPVPVDEPATLEPSDPATSDETVDLGVWQTAMDNCTTVEELRQVYNDMENDPWAKGNKVLRAYFWKRKKEIEQASNAQPAQAGPEPDRQATWMAVLALAGERGWSTTDVSQAFREWAGVDVSNADGRQIAAFLDYLRSEAMPA